MADTGLMTRRTVIMCSAGAAAACTLRPAPGEPSEWAGWVELGGVEQWVTIRGDDGRKPTLLWVHGGPGFAMSAFVDEFAIYERDFTVVQWDQRGAGRTFGRHGAATPDMTLETITADGVQLAADLKARLGDRPLILVCHSLGSIVGVRMVRQAPELFAAYVGAAQFASFQQTIERQYGYLRDKAVSTGDQQLGAALDNISIPDPAGIEDFFAVNRILNRHVPEDDQAWFARMGARLPVAMTPEELTAWNAGREFSADEIIPQIVGVDLFSSAGALERPFVLIQGEADIFSPAVIAADYYRALEAPQKSVTMIENTGHFPFLTHPEAFRDALVEAATVA